MDNKKIFAENLKKQMTLKEKSRKDISEALGISYYTVTDWVTGKKYPRMNKVEMLADYFGILKSDLIEEKTEKELQTAEKNNALADIIVKMRTDDEFFSIVKLICSLDENQIKAVKQMLNAFIK